MTLFRRLAGGLVLLAAASSVSAAQANRNFEDAWFWGVKAGGMTYWTNRVAAATAPTAGIEWLLTRRHYAMNLSLEQAFFTSRATVISGTTIETVNIKNMRRATASLFVFPRQFKGFRPYAGIGGSLNVLQEAKLANAAAIDSIRIANENRKSAILPLATIGLQAQYRRFSVFGQGGYQPSGQQWHLNGKEMLFFEAGIRVNLGTSKDDDF